MNYTKKTFDALKSDSLLRAKLVIASEGYNKENEALHESTIWRWIMSEDESLQLPRFRTVIESYLMDVGFSEDEIMENEKA